MVQLNYGIGNDFGLSKKTSAFKKAEVFLDKVSDK